jgi:hypothetical protein
MSPSSTVPFPRFLRILLRALLVVWASFWAWFVLAVSFGEAPQPPWWIPVAWLGGLGTLVALCWRWPGLGGAVLVAAGTWAGIHFDDPGARALLAAPAIALGLGSLFLGWGARRVASTALLWLGLGLVLVGCLAPQDPADRPFRTSSILRHENGQLRRAFLLEETEIGGFACQRWIWWYEDGRLENLELAQDRNVQGHAFPRATRLFFDREGRLAHAWLSQDTVIDGLPCRGRWKIDTAFHPNGRVKAFFPPDDLALSGVLCEASVFHPVYLHADGKLRRCKLAAPATLDGHTHAAGEVLELPER